MHDFDTPVIFKNVVPENDENFRRKSVTLGYLIVDHHSVMPDKVSQTDDYFFHDQRVFAKSRCKPCCIIRKSGFLGANILAPHDHFGAGYVLAQAQFWRKRDLSNT